MGSVPTFKLRIKHPTHEYLGDKAHPTTVPNDSRFHF